MEYIAWILFVRETEKAAHRLLGTLLGLYIFAKLELSIV